MNVGTIGHVDHGKTTLTAAITKVGLVTDASACVLLDFLNEVYLLVSAYFVLGDNCC